MKKSPSHSEPPVSPARRRCLAGGATLAAALGTGSVANLMSVRPAHAADYKALVCVFLFGGNDGMNMIVPSDSTRYATYAGVRGPLAIPRSSLVPLGNSGFGLHPALSALAPAWAAGGLAPVFNIGPLVQPLTKAQYVAAAANSPLLPDSLFSHADQQTLWETGGSSVLTRTGWGGRAADTLGTANPVISLAGAARFGSGSTQAPLVLPGPGSVFGAYGLQATDTWAPQLARQAAITSLYGQAQEIDLADAYAAAQRDAFKVSARLAPIIKASPGAAGAIAAIDTAFVGITSGGKITSDLGKQLYQVANLIAGNATVQGNRQIFFASMGGFDTHGGQVVSGSPTQGTHAALLQQLGDALGAFRGALVALGLDTAVTTFTQSDFGRTFAPNNSNGTDHAWGNQHLVMGGSVKGGTTYGTYPDLVLGGANDVGQHSWELQGRWIPTSSVDQYAATLLGWFGASASQLDAILPNLSNFGSARSLGFL